MMKSLPLALATVLGFGWLVAQDDRDASTARGRYLVHHVAMCIHCHTPRGEDGEPDPQRLLQGASLPVRSPFPGREWAFFAPRLAGLPGWTAEEVAYLLRTGRRRRDGTPPQPPMPPFRMTPEDAAAVAAYLESLE